MAKMTSYSLDAVINPEDILIGSDANNAFATKNFTVGALSGYINGQSSGSPGSGTVTSVSGTGSVSGITLSGTVTSEGELTLGGSLNISSQEIIDFLGYTPYNNSNPNGFTTFSEPAIYSGGGTPTLAPGVTAEEVRSLIGAGSSDSAGTVTSVGAEAGTGISVTGAPVTTSGTITITNIAPNVTTDLSVTRDASTVTVSSSDGEDAILLEATDSVAGVMKATDKSKLDSIDNVTDNFVKNTSDTFDSAPKVKQIVTLTQNEYDNATKNAEYLYIIIG